MAFVAAILLVAAAWYHVPEVPAFDAERWFKLMFATTLRGAVEARGGDAAAWEAAVARFVAYHPAGRLPERKVASPHVDVILGKPVPGERALIEHLATLPREARWDWLYRDDPVGTDARLADPDDLGADYDPTAWIGDGWDGLAAWGARSDAAFGTAARRRLDAVVLLVESDAPTATERALFAALRAEGAIPVPADGLVAAQQAHAADLSARIVVIAGGRSPLAVLRALHADLALRERVIALVAVGADFSGEEAMDLLGHLLSGDQLGTEVARTTPYLSIGLFRPEADPPGLPGRPIEVQRFPQPTGEGLEAVDLGVLPDDGEIPATELTRALLAFLACYLASRS